MRSAAYSIYEAKTKLSALLRQVKKGHEVVISERGNPIAKIIPLSKSETFDSRLKHLTSLGIIIPAETSVTKIKSIQKPGALERFLRERE